MINCKDGEFRLNTDASSCLFRITGYGHPESAHYGARLDGCDMEPLLVKRTAVRGSGVAYSQDDATYCLDNICLEWSGIGRGDYRQSPIEAKMPDGSFVCDFTYAGHEVVPGPDPAETLPCACGTDGDCSTLRLTLTDASNAVDVTLHYTVFDKTNVIARRAVVKNRSDKPMTLRRIMSFSLDLPDAGFVMTTFDGGWISEAHRHERAVEYGIYVNSSTTGASSNRHNTGFILSRRGTDEEHGQAYGFNLLYSGNHFGAVEKSAGDLVRVQLGINPHCFEWVLGPGESFETPQAILTFSDKGFNGLSANFHDFINAHIVRSDWQNAPRPVLFNNWEACFFDFTRARLMRLARGAKKLGAELFVLDDGWFGARNNDTAGLGDYNVNLKKLPGGLARLARDMGRLGLKFGLWFEPEMVNEDSDLYRAHPDWAVTVPGKQPTRGRNQLVLDLCNPDVRDYIVGSVSRVLDSADISYVKWDMNRHISDAFSSCISNQGEFFHRYILGLYEILERIFRPRPQILLESCSSGGNRFDPGMLCFSPQVWASDDTDPVERLAIQGGLSCLYPLSTMGAHVSEGPHQQTLRDTPLSTRFNVSAFGCLGYELDLKYLTPAQKREIRGQIAFYKAHRATLQYGRFYRFDPRKDNKVHWQATANDGSESVAGFFQTQSRAAEGYDELPLTGLEPDALYRVATKPQSLYIKRFGGLIKHLLPVALNPGGAIVRTADRHYSMTDCIEEYEARGALLNVSGLRLNNQYLGSGYNKNIRLLSDFGSNLYTITKIHDKETGK